MPNAFLKVVLFVLATVAMFVYFGEELTKISGEGGIRGTEGEVSAEAGEAIFLGKGKCYTCHSIGEQGSAVRCPNLGVFGDKFSEPVAVRAAHRKAEKGMSGIQYLVESLYTPNAYIVEGYPRDLMKPMNRPPIALNDDEIAAVILYLRSKSDLENAEETIAEIRAAQKPYATGAVQAEASAATFEFPAGDPEEGKYTFEDMRCFQCHKVGGLKFDVEGDVKGGIGPDLTDIGSIQTRTYLIESILVPGKVIVADPPDQTPGGEGSYRSASGDSKMPEFHDTMTLRQLLDITAFMETLEGEKSNASRYGR